MVEVLWAFHVSMSTGIVLVQVTFRQSCWWDFILGIASDTWYDFCIMSIFLWELLNLRLGFWWCNKWTQGLTYIRQTLYFKHTNQSILSRVDQNHLKDQQPPSTVNCVDWMCHPTSIPTLNTGWPKAGCLWAGRREPLAEVPWCTVGLLISTLVRHRVYTLPCCMTRIGSIPFLYFFHELLTPGNIRGVDCFVREGRWACEREMQGKNSSLDFRELKQAQATVIPNCIDVVNKLTGREEDFNFQGNRENN